MSNKINEKTSDKEKFYNIIGFAKEILNINEFNYCIDHPIVDLIRLLGRELQSKYMKLPVIYGNNCEVPSLRWDDIGFPECDAICGEKTRFCDIKKEVSKPYDINLSKDIILPWPWEKTRLTKSISYIGHGRNWGDWQQDNLNHDVELWLPIGISWVNGGNHSITAGIIQGGSLKPRTIYDISDVYNYVKCDGLYYRRVDNNQVISKVKSTEFAAIFEIGRMMKETEISY